MNFNRDRDHDGHGLNGYVRDRDGHVHGDHVPYDHGDRAYVLLLSVCATFWVFFHDCAHAHHLHENERKEQSNPNGEFS